MSVHLAFWLLPCSLCCTSCLQLGTATACQCMNVHASGFLAASMLFMLYQLPAAGIRHALPVHELPRTWIFRCCTAIHDQPPGCNRQPLSAGKVWRASSLPQSSCGLQPKRWGAWGGDHTPGAWERDADLVSCICCTSCLQLGSVRLVSGSIVCGLRTNVIFWQ